MAVEARINNHAGLIWSIADLLRGDYKRSEYQRVILPLVLLRRLDCVARGTAATSRTAQTVTTHQRRQAAHRPSRSNAVTGIRRVSGTAGPASRARGGGGSRRGDGASRRAS